MWEPYIQLAQAHLEDADTKMVFDKFHIAKHVHDAVAKVRKAEHRALKQADDHRLGGTKYLWLMRPPDMTPVPRTAFLALRRSDFKMARAWALKERFRQFWGYTYRAAAEKFFTRWFWQATHSRLRPMAEVTRRTERHSRHILTSLQHRLTNAGLEAVNATIQWVKETARGFRSVEYFKTGSTFTAEDSIFTHTKSGRVIF